MLYSGLGGHGNVFFSLVDSGLQTSFITEALFNGVEGLRKEYKERCEACGIKYNYVKKKPGLDLNYYGALYKAIRDSNCDIIFLHTSSYILPAVLGKWFTKGKKKIVIRETQANHLKTKMEWIWLSIGLLFTDQIVFLSEDYKKEIEQKLKWLYREKKVVVIPNGIDLNKFYLKERLESDREFIIGMQSRIVKIKDYPTLLKAVSIVKQSSAGKNRQVTLKIAGDGDLRPELEKLAIDLGISESIKFEGLLNEKELILFLQSLDLYVHASLGETMSTAIMQAMACGLPLIASDVRGINNMVQNQVNGILSPPLDDKHLARLIITMMTDTAFRRKIASGGLAYAKDHFSNERMCVSYKELVFDKPSQC